MSEDTSTGWPDDDGGLTGETDDQVSWRAARGGRGAWQLREPFGRGAGTPRADGPADGVVYAEFGLRAVAFAIDQATVLLLAGWTGALLGDVLDAFLTGAQRVDPVVDFSFAFYFYAVASVGLLVNASVIVYSLRILWGSPGQLALGLSTLRWRDGAGLGLRAATARWLLLFGPAALAVGWPRALTGRLVPDVPWLGDILNLAPLLAVVWYALLAVSTLRDPRGRGFHDRLAGTIVVREVDLE